MFRQRQRSCWQRGVQLQQLVPRQLSRYPSILPGRRGGGRRWGRGGFRWGRWGRLTCLTCLSSVGTTYSMVVFVSEVQKVRFLCFCDLKILMRLYFLAALYSLLGKCSCLVKDLCGVSELFYYYCFNCFSPPLCNPVTVYDSVGRLDLILMWFSAYDFSTVTINLKFRRFIHEFIWMAS